MRRNWHRTVFGILTLCCWSQTALATGPIQSVISSPVLRPAIGGDWWSIAGNPDLGALSNPRQQPVDFAVWQAADGSWQLWSCIRKTNCGGKTRLFYRWEGRQLTDRDWTPIGIAMQADAQFGETPGGLQAPHVIKIGTVYHMFYGDWEHICHATSQDGKTFTRVVASDGHTGLFSEGPGCNTRDVMLLLTQGRWHAYYTAYPNRHGAVFCRTTSDFVTWSDSRRVAFGGQAGTGPSSAECPHVVLHQNHYYLFRTQRYGSENKTSVYRSTDPQRFGINQDASYYVGWLPVAAPEIIRQKDEMFIAALNLGLDGIRMARLKWVASQVSSDERPQQSPQ